MGLRHILNGKCVFLGDLLMFGYGRVIDYVTVFVGLVTEATLLLLKGCEISIPPPFREGVRGANSSMVNWMAEVNSLTLV